MINISGQTKIVGVIGEPVTHSRSPQMHNAAIAKLGLNFAYLPFEVKLPDLAMAIQGLKALQVVGVNVTIPHKQNVMPLLDHISTEAHLIGAVNTLVFDQDQIFGHNTDAEGFIRAMQEEASLFDLLTGDVRAVVLGAGGAARAVVTALALNNVTEITIANRTVSKAVTLVENLEPNLLQTDLQLSTRLTSVEIQSSQLADLIATCDLLVNTTSVGMDNTAQVDLFNLDCLSARTIVYDIVYTPPVTPLLRVAEARGCPIIGGLGMLVHQGAIAFEKWTGIEPNIEVMREALIKSLGLSAKRGKKSEEK
ncbi:shikimate dehydrogenase [Candidatus Poribacteria bacterium]|nr:shikimate dehydrogenase [Candidatus Poribacteria bacterium]